jgi:N-acylneuraminate cytidylyltransferase
MVNSQRIAIILARGGSKRLPRKNILDFGGKPMLAWSILAAIESEQFDKVLVSTDDEEIAGVGKLYGAEVPFLRNAAADDVSSSSLATCEALIQAESHWNIKFETVVQLMANCPLRGAKDIKKSILAFEASSAPSQISCFQFGWMNPWWAVQLDDDGKPTSLFPKELLSRSQDLPNLFCPSGAIWIAKRDALTQTKNFYMENHRFEPTSWIAAMDIDDVDDLLMAQMGLLILDNKFK